MSAHGPQRRMWDGEENHAFPARPAMVRGRLNTQ
jgi:hypothetical protein